MPAGAMQSVLVGVRSIESSLVLFRDIVGFTVEADYAASEELVAAWQLAPGTQVRLVDLAYLGYPVGRIRLAQYDPPASQAVRLDMKGGGDSPTDVGPKAIDFYVHKSMDESVAEIEAAGFPPRSQPIRHTIGAMESEEFVFTGPDGVPCLMMIGHQHSADSHRTTGPLGDYSEIATTSIVCGDLTASRRFYGDVLGMVTGTDAETPAEFRDIVDDLTGVPRGTRVHFLVYQAAGEPSGKYLLVHFFDATGQRLTGRMRPGNLGVSLFTHVTPDVRAVVDRATAAGFPIVTPPTTVDLGPTGRREIALVRGPNEELVEVRTA